MKTYRVFLMAGSLWLGACATLDVAPFPDPIRPPKTLPTGQAADSADQSQGDIDPAASDSLGVRSAPGVRIPKTVAEGLVDRLGQDLSGEPVSVTFNNLPLPSFINQVFGEELGMPFVLSPGLRERTDLVTLRLPELTPSQLFAAARRILGDYGIEIRDQDGILNFVASQEIASSDIPLLISGRTLPEVPASHRRIFHIVPLRVAETRRIMDWLLDAFEGRDLRIDDDRELNALVLKGGPDLVSQALAMIEVLDQPLIQGKHGFILEPRYLSPEEMAGALEDVLQAEGYDVRLGRRGGSSILIPLPDLNKVAVFAADQRARAHIVEWARILDERQQESIEDGFFSYEVQNIQAEQLANTLNQLLGSTRFAENRPAVQAPQAQGDGAERRGGRGGAIIVDKNSNALLFRGSGKEWAEILGVIALLDRAVPSVLIEVLIAEITLSDEEGSGFEFVFNAAGGELRGGTQGRLGVGAKGLALTLDSAGQTRATLNLFREESRVIIRSNPRLVVKSGGTANIQVGNEIPVTMQRTESGVQTGGTSNILQQVSYRQTGIQLDIIPVVQANGLVDLTISQEFSEARPTADTSLDGTPTILRRQLATNLTLRDGGSLLMGGLISTSRSGGETRIPGLGRLPLAGRLFRAGKFQEDRTELVILVIPYVIADHEEGWELTKRVREQLQLHEEYLRED